MDTNALNPNSVCAVINQGNGRTLPLQFLLQLRRKEETKFTEPRAYERVGKVARLMLDTVCPRTLTDGATYYPIRRP